jgi:hypothetical protein
MSLTYGEDAKNMDDDLFYEFQKNCRGSKTAQDFYDCQSYFLPGLIDAARSRGITVNNFSIRYKCGIDPNESVIESSQIDCGQSTPTLTPGTLKIIYKCARQSESSTAIWEKETASYVLNCSHINR